MSRQACGRLGVTRGLYGATRMAWTRLRRSSTCPACGTATPAPTLCGDCFECFALARRVHPSAGLPAQAPRRRPSAEVDVAHDMDLWDAWALLGDVGDSKGRLPLS